MRFSGNRVPFPERFEQFQQDLTSCDGPKALLNRAASLLGDLLDAEATAICLLSKSGELEYQSLHFVGRPEVNDDELRRIPKETMLGFPRDALPPDPDQRFGRQFTTTQFPHGGSGSQFYRYYVSRLDSLRNGIVTPAGSSGQRNTRTKPFS
jgi:hypothetical protein